MGCLFGCNESRDCSEIFARNLYNAGYRKSTDVAEEIFAEIDKLTVSYINDADYTIGDMILGIVELKKKYTEEENCGR